MEVETKGKDPNSRDSDDDGLKLGGNIVLMGFSLDPAEMIIVKKIVGHYAKKINEKTKYNELKIYMKKSQKQQSFLHELSVTVTTDNGILSAEKTDKNIYSGLSEVLDDIYNQAQHQEK